MGLCGGFRCGCGVTSTPATEGAINGELPSINVSGSGEPLDPYDLSLNDAWAAEVASVVVAAEEQLANLPASIQTGVVTGTTNSTGYLTVTFPTAFDSAPNVVVTPNSTNTSQGFISAITATTFTWRAFSAAGAALATASITLQWMAVGDPA